MLGTFGFPISERGLVADPVNMVTLVANTPKQLLPEQRFDKAGLGQIGQRYIQNATGARLYLTFGITDGVTGLPTASDQQYHAFVEDGQLFDCSCHRMLVTGFSVGGGKVATVIMRRPQGT